MEKEVVLSPKLFLDVVQRQWSAPGSEPFASSQDKRFYNVGPDLAKLLEVPAVGTPVVALSSPLVIFATGKQEV